MKKKILSYLGGIVAAAAGIALMQTVSKSLYPPPPDLGIANTLATELYLANIPDGAFLFAIAGMVLGGFAGGFAATALDQKNGTQHTVIIAVLLTLFGVLGMMMVTHPLKFWIVNIITYIPCALAGSAAARKMKH